jgi:CubicO group peptidase (beta-lactamase class C family)
MLTMTLGLPEDNPWGDRQLDEPDQMLTELLEAGLSFSNPPSHSYEYSNVGYALLGQVVSRVSGTSFQKYITDNILLPLGMEHTVWDYDEVPQGKLAQGYRWENEKWSTEPMLHDGSFGAMATPKHTRFWTD